MLADFNAIKQQLVNARLADGTPIPVTELRDLAVDANILPSIFNTETQNLWLGRSRRTASEAQRIALTARDEHCIGCQANPLWCRAHHIIWWSHDGKTDFNNLLLVCDRCHHKIHDQGRQVHQHPKTRKFYLKPPTNPDQRSPAKKVPCPRGSMATRVVGGRSIPPSVPPARSQRRTDDSTQQQTKTTRPDPR